jgi:hypothetical protein
MSANFVDALKGYDYFLSKRGNVKIAEVNMYLRDQGRNPIRQRTYLHYTKLLENGFRSYIPINKFDVFEALGKLSQAADRRRFARDRVEISAQITTDGLEWIDVTVIDESAVSFGITAPRKLVLRPGTPLYIRLPGYSAIPSFVAWSKVREGSAALGLRALQFTTQYLLAKEPIDLTLLTGLLTVRREAEASIPWGSLITVLSKTDQLIESTSTFLYAVDEVVGARIRLPSPVISTVRFGSPGTAGVKIDPGLAEVFKVIIDSIRFWGLEKRKLRAESTKLELEAQKLEIENVNLHIETMRNALKLRQEAKEAGMAEQIIPALETALKAVFKTDELPEGLLGQGTPERAILVQRVLPAALDLVAGDDPDYDIDVATSEEQQEAA